eukprot:scaffold88801_cov55-Attheya_sp.AAC.2
MRTPHGHDETAEHSDHGEHKDGAAVSGCHHAGNGHGVSEDMRSMGQTLNLMGPEGEESATPVSGEELEEQRRVMQKEREAREIKIRAELESMSLQELLNAILKSQSERTMTYKEYDRGLHVVLESGNLSSYPNVCAKATASFAVLSDSINVMKGILASAKWKRPDLATLVKKLQDCEREKLNATAALHLEQLRATDPFLLEQDGKGDKRVSKLLHEGALSLKAKVAQTIEDINDIIEELRCEAADQE